MARPPRHRIELSEGERGVLERIGRAEKLPFQDVPRALIVLYAAEGFVRWSTTRSRLTIQRPLDHNSPEMTARYAQIKDQTLRREWERYQQRINIRGERIPLDPNGRLSDAAWAKENLARAKQPFPNGSWLVEMNEPVEVNLLRIIDGLEALEVVDGR